ncbi:MAG: RecQ family ATP-dependent DNA helicase [Deltaproteobacteria bacterium]|nr:RecQ family ATP-dependent DNA helicase [Deltaproteobacteria bacterium]
MAGIIPAYTKETMYRQALKKYFNYDSFREGQEAIIQAVLRGENTLAVLPTGAGKSLCFQLPALLRPGLTLVVSPLISLMKDQVDALTQNGIPATFVNSSLGWTEMRRRLADMNRYRLVYIAPERFNNEWFLASLRRINVSLFVVDEAHCVSMWGHDFRPDYLKLKDTLDLLGRPQVMACTATATEEVRKDITCQLGLTDPTVIVRGFSRENLSLAVRRTTTHLDKLARTMEILRDHPTGIVYCATRANVDRLAAKLKSEGICCIAYHGGLEDAERKHAQELFIRAEVPVAVATNAFGMGIDRPDLRTIIHWDVPGSIEAYYQQAGRAGRDGRPAHCELLFSHADVYTQKFFIQKSNPQIAERERSRLRRLLAYVNSPNCRHATILRYFGDPAGQEMQACKQCDNCQRNLTASSQARRPATPEESQEIHKTLSCISNMNGRFGRTRICQTLCGSRDQQILRFGLNRSLLYASLQNQTQSYVMKLIDTLLDEGCLEVTGDEYPTIQLTPSGYSVLSKEKSISLPLSAPRPPAKPKQPDPQTASASLLDTSLLDALRSMRARLAKERKVPAYLILHNKTIEEIARNPPHDLTSLLARKGIGPAKLADIGEHILEVVRCHVINK